MRGRTTYIGITRTLFAVGVALSMLAPITSLAADGTITFTGAVTENSCTVQVNGAGSGDGTVALPVVDTRALGVTRAPKNTAAGTYFNITVSHCAVTRAVAAWFEAGPNVDPVTHALINTGTSNVEVKLYEATAATAVGSQVSPGTAGAGQQLDGSGTWYFYAGYSLAGDGAARAGTVNTSITYSLTYL